MKLTDSKGFRKFIIVLLIFSGVAFLFYLVSPRIPVVNRYASNKDYIAVLYLQGTIMRGDSGGLLNSGGSYNHGYILSQIDAFIEDDHNKGLVLFIDSPGGGIYETDEVYLKVLEYKEKTGLPVYASMGSMAASGGYYISAAADKIYANRNTITGSIGVTMGTFYDVSEFLNKHGIHTTTMIAGENKAMGSMTSPMSPEQKQIYQSLLDESYEQFINVIIEGRDISEEEIRKIADGRIYSAKQANELGLVDYIGTLDNTIQAIIEDNKLSDCEIRSFWYEDDSFLSFIKGLAATADRFQSSEIDAVLKLLDRQEHIPIAYLYDFNR